MLRRTRKAGKEEPVPTRVNKKGLVLPSLDLLIGLLGSLSVVLILASFPLLGAAAVALLGFVSIGQMYPKLVFAIAKTGEVAGGLVLALGMADKGIEVLVASARSVCAGGVSAAGFLSLLLTIGTWASRNASQETTTTPGVEEEGECAEEKEEYDLSSENRPRRADVNSHGVNAARLPATVAAAEAGRLRRAASAMLQNKVWDPGGH